jgi:dolichyl-phosphate-mannose--protein O-mannosyl transferase
MADYYKFMKKANAGVAKLDVCKTEGENGSNPLDWLIMRKNITYRSDGNNGKVSYVQLAGNRVSWALGLAALVLSVVIVLSHRILRAPIRNKPAYELLEIFTGLYFVYLGLHLFLASQRVMYLYHYFHGLLITFLLVPLVWLHLEEVHSVLRRHRYPILLTMVGCIYASFLFTSPLTYHRPLTKSQCERRNWLGHVVDCH